MLVIDVVAYGFFLTILSYRRSDVKTSYLKNQQCSEMKKTSYFNINFLFNMVFCQLIHLKLQKVTRMVRDSISIKNKNIFEKKLRYVVFKLNIEGFIEIRVY